jgi:hypothetical protein
VKIAVEGADTTLRPGMTTGNEIETQRVEKALFVSLEALNGDGETPFVYRQAGGRVTRQEVETGAMNDDESACARRWRGSGTTACAPRSPRSASCSAWRR